MESSWEQGEGSQEGISLLGSWKLSLVGSINGDLSESSSGSEEVTPA